MKYDIIIVGGGPAGLAAACAAGEAGAENILIIERDKELGGILNQCIHNGFGLHYFKEELTGPEYAGRFEKLLNKTNVSIRTDAMVLHVEPERRVHSMSTDGYRIDEAETVILAMGCRERPRGAVGIPGTRPAGILTAGTAQRFINIEGLPVGKRVVILGSGDIGLIMARRLTLEGAKVEACIELMPYSSGLKRNIVQCLEDYDIPLYLSHTITDIRGKERVTGITMAQVDEKRQPIPGTEQDIACDTVLLSVGLIPENELSREAGIEIDARTGGPVVYENMETTLPGIFACGNVVQVHDLVDFVTLESQKAGRAAAGWRDEEGAPYLAVTAGSHVTYTVPQRIRHTDEKAEISFRADAELGKSRILVKDEEENIIAHFRRQYIVPGEMEHITVPPALMRRAKGTSLKVEVVTV